MADMGVHDRRRRSERQGLGDYLRAGIGESHGCESHRHRGHDDALLKHPKVVILALHVQPENSANNVIIASNIGRIGKKADEDDLHVIATGEDKLELNDTGDRYEVEQTLKDISGTTIGAVGVVFAYAKGQDTAPLQAEAKAVRAELAARIPSAAALLAHR